MIDNIIGPFQYGFMVRALIVSVLVGVMWPGYRRLRHPHAGAPSWVTHLPIQCCLRWW